MPTGKVSSATEKNWKRLGVSGKGRLRKGANKNQSERRLLPTEYVVKPENLSTFSQWTDELSERGDRMEDLLYSIGRIAWKERGIDTYNPFAKQLIRQYERKLLELSIPNWEGEEDFLGILYQSLRREGEKNYFGAYYTPRETVREMTEGLDFSSGQKLLDPCLGSGGFLLESGAPPESIVGMDIDPVAVMISVFNFYLRFPNYEGLPSFFHADFLTEEQDEEFDYIVTNPPWGSSVSKDQQEDTFVQFFRRAWKFLKPGGEIRFLLPESVRNVRIHERFRRDLLTDLNLTELRIHSRAFEGVMSGSVELRAKKEIQRPHFRMISGGREICPEKKELLSLPHANFSWLEPMDFSILRKVKDRGERDLSSSHFALGIVTGDNARHLSPVRRKGMEPIVVGKDISIFEIKEPSRFIHFDRKGLQQVSPDEAYRTLPKLVYRFIANRPVFAPDYDGRLCLNSANILIPNIPGMSIETVAAFLNSNLYAYLYMLLFGERKILKGNLTRLPFPSLTSEEECRIRTAVRDYGAKRFDLWDAMISDVFELSSEERRHLLERINFVQKTV